MSRDDREEGEAPAESSPRRRRAGSEGTSALIGKPAAFARSWPPLSRKARAAVMSLVAGAEVTPS